MADPVVVWAPQPGPQSALITCPITEVLYGGARGGGKGLRPDEVVLTPFGWRKIGDLKPGDKLCAVDGTVTHVLGVWRRGVQPFYRCHLSDGSSIDCDGDHIWLGWRANQTRKIGNEPTSGHESARKHSMAELLGFVNQKRDRSGFATNRFAIPVPLPMAFNVAGSLKGPGVFVKREIDPYVLGVLLGDGCVSGDRSPSFFSDDQQIVNEMARRLAGTAELSRYSSADRCPSYGIVNGGALKAQLERLGVWGMKSDTKAVPRIYLMGSVDERWDLLRGLMDTDGWAEQDGDIYFASTSRALAQDVRHLAWSLGGVVTWREKTKWCTYKGERRDGAPCYEIRIKLRDNSMAFLLDRKKERCAGKQHQTLCRYIERIEPLEPSESVCIAVAHPSSLFITRDFIVTHNTDGVLGDFACHAQQYGEHAIGRMFRRERIQLQETIERAKQIYLPVGAKFNEVDKMFRFPNGARLAFSYLDRDVDADAYQGHSYTRVYIEEVGTFPDPTPILKLMATLRSAQGVPVGFRATGNPGGPGHGWIRQRYIDPAPGGWTVIKDPRTGLERIYIPARVSDNPALLKNDPDYVSRIKASGPELLVRAWLDGDWSIIQGAFFDNLSADLHFIPDRPFPEHWFRFRALDWGSYAPFSVGWYTVADGKDDQFPRGAVIRYAEWYGGRADRPDMGLKLDPIEVAAGILARQRSMPPIATVGVADPAIFMSDGGPSIAERMARAGVTWRRGDNRRVPGWTEVRQRLNGQDGVPMFYITHACPVAMRTLASIQHDKRNPEDCETDGEDHCFKGDTLVRTRQGMARLDQLVGSTGEVMSQDGHWHPYRSARLIARNQPVIRLTFTDHPGITCTPDHLFLTTKGWIAAQNLRGHEILSCFRIPSRSSLVFAITSAARTFSAKACGSISRCGSITLGHALRAITSIIGTGLTTTGLPVLSFCLPRNTSGTGTVSSHALAVGLPSRTPDRPQQSGTEVKKVWIGTAATTRPWSGGESKPRQSFAARIVALCSSARRGEAGSASLRARLQRDEHPESMTSKGNAECVAPPSRQAGSQRPSAAQESALVRPAAPQGVVCLSVEPAGRADVYCLTVPDTGNFLVGEGLVVANCPDEIRYALMSRPLTNDAAPEPRDWRAKPMTIAEMVERYERSRRSSLAWPARV